jgi:hypothetical protein
LRWTAPDIDHLIASFGSNMPFNEPAAQRAPPNRALKGVVQKWNFQPAQ